MLASGYSAEGSRFEEFVAPRVEMCKDRPEDPDPEPDQVADAVLHAYLMKIPKNIISSFPNSGRLNDDSQSN